MGDLQVVCKRKLPSAVRGERACQQRKLRQEHWISGDREQLMRCLSDISEVWLDYGRNSREHTLPAQRHVPSGNVPVVATIPSDTDASLQRIVEHIICGGEVHALFHHHFGWHMRIRTDPAGQRSSIANG